MSAHLEIDAAAGDRSGAELGAPRRLPVVRGDCLPGGTNASRPCPWSACRHHIRREQHHRSTAVEDVCALDLAAEGPMRLEAVGQIVGLTRERIRQIEQTALRKLAAAMRRLGTDRDALNG